jgi:hypothetical protein
MKFRSENERMQHPQARLIPLSVWKDVFYSRELSDFQLTLMQTTPSDLGNYLASLDDADLQAHNKGKKIQDWFAMAYSHPDITDDLLMDFAGRLNLSDEQLFCLTAEIGKRSLLERLMERAPDKVQGMIAANNYEAFWKAAKNGHLPVMERLMERAPDNVQGMISAGGYEAFRYAAKNGHLPVMERLMERAPDKVQDMIAANNYEAFWKAAENGHLPVMERLLQFTSVLAYAEMHEHEYGERYIYPFVNERLRTLQERHASFERDNPQAVFDIDDPEEAKLCFYMLRNLIRRNNPALLDSIRFLIEIPSVKALLHTEVTPRQPNELLRLALSEGNQAAAGILLTVPAVFELTRAQNFYRQEARGGLNLEALARDRESSMTALTSGEKKRLDDAIKVYQPIIRSRGINAVMTELRHVLISRYQANPACVQTGDGRVIELPASWSEWCELRPTLSADTREQALHAYAQNTHHTAWRYLQKPNPWMAEDAPYVNRNAAGGWSTFEDYQPLIAMFFLGASLGASDGGIAPCDGHTLETRLEHFIDELAHIGRAHNWDRSRTNDLGVSEEYDDLEGDKPSCYSGVKRRLFQSVLGHPLLKLLTMDDVKQELREFVREYFQQCIQTNPEDAIEWKKAWDTVCETGLGGEGLTAMDIPQEEQEVFIQALRNKYPSQFDEDPSFKTYIQDRFKLTEHISTHAARFGGEADLTSLLEPLVIEEPIIQDVQNEIHENESLTLEEVRALRLKRFTPERDSQPSNETAPSEAGIHEEHSNDESMPPTAIQPPHIAAQPHIKLFLDSASDAINVLDEYAAGASVHEIISQLREHITQANMIYSDEVSLSTNQQEQLKTHLVAIREGLSSLKPNHFEGKPRNDFTSIIRSMLNGVTLLFSWLGAPKDRNLVAEMTGRPFFFPRSKTEDDNNTIKRELDKLDNLKDSLASAIENILDEPEGPEI